MGSGIGSSKKLGDILFDLGYVTEVDIRKALEIQKASKEPKRLGEILCELTLNEEQLLRALSIQFDIPLIDDDNIPDALPIEKISYDFMKKNSLLPLRLEGNLLSIALYDPTNTEAIDSIRASFDYAIKPYLAPKKTIDSHIETLHASRDSVMQRLVEGVSDEDMGSMESGSEVSHLKDIAQDKGIISLVNLIIDNAIKENASDIHIEPEETAVRVRYRIDGILYEREILPVKTQAAMSSRVKLLAQMNIAERRLPQDGRIRGKFSGKEIDIRVSTLPTVYGESIVMRLLDKEGSWITLEDLGFDQLIIGTYGQIIKKPFGMILITGPTGSGKTTTLYASLDRINSPEKKIITIEEPVEYLLKGINQIQVRPKIGLSFANGLRSIVRQDPDIIMVGEIRDVETASIAIHAALTGHLLFSTLHTNDAPSAITRLIDMGVENYLVSSTLIGVVAQRLVRRVCPDCKESYRAPEEITLQFGPEFGTLCRGRGCDNCMGTGYRGRVAIFEILAIEDQIRDLVMKKANSRDIKDKAIALGMRTLREDGLIKVRQGVTTIDEVMRVTQAE